MAVGGGGICRCAGGGRGWGKGVGTAGVVATTRWPPDRICVCATDGVGVFYCFLGFATNHRRVAAVLYCQRTQQ